MYILNNYTFTTLWRNFVNKKNIETIWQSFGNLIVFFILIFVCFKNWIILSMFCGHSAATLTKYVFYFSSFSCFIWARWQFWSKYIKSYVLLLMIEREQVVVGINLLHFLDWRHLLNIDDRWKMGLIFNFEKGFWSTGGTVCTRSKITSVLQYNSGVYKVVL